MIEHYSIRVDGKCIGIACDRTNALGALTFLRHRDTAFVIEPATLAELQAARRQQKKERHAN